MPVTKTRFVHGATLALALASVAAGRMSAQAPAEMPERGAIDRIARIDSLFQRAVDSARIPGAEVIVLQHGKRIYHRAFGWRDREAGSRMTRGTLFRIASQTKAITSVAALILVEEGRLSLTDPVGRYIPSFARTTVAVRTDSGIRIVPARRAITVRDLLAHTAGISYGFERSVMAQYEAAGLGGATGHGWYTADKDEPICATMERLGTLPFVAQPGEAWVYGYATDVLGCIVERASGIALDAFIRTRITGPLGMVSTSFFVGPADRDRLAAVYTIGADGRIVRADDGAKGQGAYVAGPRRSFSGGAGLVSTAADYARFLEMIRGGGRLDGVRILSPRSVRLMTTNQVGTLYNMQGLGFGLGFETTERFGANGLDDVGAYGWGGAYGSYYRTDPASGITFVMLTQLIPNDEDMRQRFPTLVYQAFAAR